MEKERYWVRYDSIQEIANQAIPKANATDHKLVQVQLSFADEFHCYLDMTYINSSDYLDQKVVVLVDWDGKVIDESIADEEVLQNVESGEYKLQFRYDKEIDGVYLLVLCFEK